MMKPLAAAAALSFLALPALAKEPMEVKSTGAPGMAEGHRLVKVTAEVTAVDKETRSVTLKGKGGRVETIKVGPQVKRFEEIAVGDTVVVEYEQGLALQFQMPDEPARPLDTAVVGGRAGKEEAPGGAAAAAVTGTVKVTAIDREHRMVVIQGPEGNLHQVKVGQNVQLDRLKVGDQLFATYTEAVAMRLEKKKAPAPKQGEKKEATKEEGAKK